MKNFKKLLSTTMAVALAIGSMTMSVSAAPAKVFDFTITNPYASVNWATYVHYKSALHSHSTDSDGAQTKARMIEEHYTMGYDIFAPADHDVLTRDFTSTARTFAAFRDGTNDGRGNIDAARVAEIATGVGRYGRGMIGVPDSNEHSRTEHINGFFAPLLIENATVLNGRGANAPGRMLETVRLIEEAGGISHINHSGRFTGGADSNFVTGEAASNNPVHIKTHVDIFMEFPSCVGMEIVNRLDNESRSDRILWDNILMQTMPYGRNVWGFSNDDSHSVGEVGWNYNMHIMPELSTEAFRKSMETGTFFAVAPVARREGINAIDRNGNAMRSGGGNAATEYLRESADNPFPKVTNIVAGDNRITITAKDYDAIEWIADGKIIATGNTLNLLNHVDEINSYVRAQVKSDAAIVFTQPFGIQGAAAAISLVTPSGMVKKGDYINIGTTFNKTVESNASVLHYTFDAAMFDYANFTPAAGVTVLNTEFSAGYATITVMVDGYSTLGYGELMLRVRDDLNQSDYKIELLANLAIRLDSGIKEIQSFATSGNLVGTPVPGTFSLIDLSDIIDAFGIDSTHAEWIAKYRFWDFTNSGVINIANIVYVAQRVK